MIRYFLVSHLMGVVAAAHMTVTPQVRLDPAVVEVVTAAPVLLVQQAKVIQVDLVQTQAAVEVAEPELQVAMQIMAQGA